MTYVVEYIGGSVDGAREAHAGSPPAVLQVAHPFAFGAYIERYLVGRHVNGEYRALYDGWERR